MAITVRKKRFIKITNSGAANTAAVTSKPTDTATNGVSNDKTYTVELGYLNGLVVGIVYK